MPEPDWYDSGDIFQENPQKSLEILGVGSQSRKSKTLLQNSEVAYILARIRNHRGMLVELLRRAHARKYTRPVLEEDDEGEMVEAAREPEVLSDDEIYRIYPSVRAWRELHQEVVDHFISVGGFSVRAATSLPDDDRPRRGGESSAGSDDAARRRVSSQGGDEGRRW